MNHPTTPALAVCYLRVSTAGQATDGTSLESQEATTRAEALRLGASVASVHRDEVSGVRYASRAGLQAALSQVEALRRAEPSRPVLLVIAKWDRSARDIGVQREIQRRLSAAGCRLVSCDGTPTDDTPVSRLSQTMRGAFGEFESDIIRERTQEGRNKVAAQGRQPARSLRPFGYRIIQKADVYPGSAWSEDDLGRYVVLEEEAAAVRVIFARYASGEWSLRTAVKWLEEQGIPSVRGGRWVPGTLWAMLQRTAYVGRATYGKKEQLRSERADGTIAYGRRIRPAEEVVTIPCPALVSEETFAAVQLRLSTNQARYGGNPERRHLLSGLLRCPECGRGLFGVRHTKWTYYRCDPSADCSRRQWRGDVLERLTIAAVAQVAASPTILAAALAAARARARAAVGDIDTIGALLVEARRRESAAVQAEVAALAEGRDATPYRVAVEGLSQRRRMLEEQMRAAEMAAPKATDVDTAQIRRALSMAGELLTDERLPLHERASALRWVVERVVPFDDLSLPHKASAKPTPGARVHLLMPHSVGGVTLRATLSGDGVRVEGADGG